MNTWDITKLDLSPGSPQILFTDDARAIVLEISAGEALTEHQVHERALVTVIEGEARITTADEEVRGGPGLLIEFDPRERHAVYAETKVRILLVLTPWPGDGHPGHMTLKEKASVRQRAAQVRPE